MTAFLYGVLVGFIGANAFLYYVEIYDEKRGRDK